MEPSDRDELLARWSANDDREALEKLLILELADLKQRIQRGDVPVSPASVSDIAQEAALRFLRAQARFPTPAAMRAYLRTAARNLEIAHILDMKAHPHRARKRALCLRA